MNSQTPVIGSTAPPPPIVFTDAAALKASELIEEEDHQELKLRGFISDTR